MRSASAFCFILSKSPDEIFRGFHSQATLSLPVFRASCSAAIRRSSSRRLSSGTSGSFCHDRRSSNLSSEVRHPLRYLSRPLSKGFHSLLFAIYIPFNKARLGCTLLVQWPVGISRLLRLNDFGNRSRPIYRKVRFRLVLAPVL